MENKPIPDQVDVARFSDRVVAFSMDYLLFAVGYWATLKALAPSEPLWTNPHAGIWTLVWAVLFILYQAVMSSEGRVSVGKKLMGLRVVDLNGEAISLPKALIRSAGYLPSSFFAGGFLWYFSNPARQTWHDLMAGSVVVEAELKSPPVRKRIQAAAAACMVLFAGMWLWDHSLSRNYTDSMNMAYAEVGLREIDSLQRLHYAYNDRYADNLLDLAALSSDPVAFMKDIDVLFDKKSGIDIEVRGDSYVVTAFANDREKTPIRHIGKPKNG